MAKTNAERARAFAEEAARNMSGEHTYLLDQAKVYAQLAVADAVDRQTSAITTAVLEQNAILTKALAKTMTYIHTGQVDQEWA